MITFGEWLNQASPEGGGEIWDNRSNADRAFGRTGARSKNVTQDKVDGFRVDAEKLYFGDKKKQVPKLNIKDILGGLYGSNQQQSTNTPGNYV
jgi:hypothetical protein